MVGEAGERCSEIAKQEFGRQTKIRGGWKLAERKMIDHARAPTLGEKCAENINAADLDVSLNLWAQFGIVPDVEKSNLTQYFLIVLIIILLYLQV